MTKSAGLIALILLGTTAVSFARKAETLQELVARADASPRDKQPALYMKAAELQHDAAVAAIKAQRWEEFFSDLKDIVILSDKAHTAAIASNKHLKDTEIKIRRISTHLKEAKFDVGVDDQPTVQAAIDQLEKFRTELLDKMFEGKRHD